MTEQTPEQVEREWNITDKQISNLPLARYSYMLRRIVSYPTLTDLANENDKTAEKFAKRLTDSDVICNSEKIKAYEQTVKEYVESANEFRRLASGESKKIEFMQVPAPYLDTSSLGNDFNIWYLRFIQLIGEDPGEGYLISPDNGERIRFSGMGSGEYLQIFVKEFYKGKVPEFWEKEDEKGGRSSNGLGYGLERLGDYSENAWNCGIVGIARKTPNKKLELSKFNGIAGIFGSVNGDSKLVEKLNERYFEAVKENPTLIAIKQNRGKTK